MDKKFHWILQVAILTVAALASGIGISMGESLAANPAPGSAGAASMQNAVPAFVIIGAGGPLLAEAPPGSQAGEDQPAAGGKRAYNNTPESVIQLLKDSKAAVDKKTAGKSGVHFKGNFTLSVEGVMINSRGEGDIIPPDKGKLWAELHLPYVSDGFGELLDIIVLGRSVYAKPYWSQEWASRNVKPSPYGDAVDGFDFTRFVINPQLLRQETMQNGVQAYHVRVEVDTAAIIKEVEDQIKTYADEITPEKLEKLKSSIISNDIWIGVSDLLVYQVTEKFLNTDLQMAFDDMSVFYDWGKEVEITAPPAENTHFLPDEE